MATHCESCGKPFGMSRRPTRTATGRDVCASCGDGVTAAAAGVLSNPGQPVAGAITTEGWFRRVTRRRRRKDDSA